MNCLLQRKRMHNGDIRVTYVCQELRGNCAFDYNREKSGYLTVLFFLGSPTQLVKLWWGERSCSEYLLPERSLGTYTRNLPAKIKGEVRFASVAKQFPKEADELFAAAQENAQWRYKSYLRMLGTAW